MGAGDGVGVGGFMGGLICWLKISPILSLSVQYMLDCFYLGLFVFFFSMVSLVFVMRCVLCPCFLFRYLGLLVELSLELGGFFFVSVQDPVKFRFSFSVLFLVTPVYMIMGIMHASTTIHFPAFVYLWIVCFLLWTGCFDMLLPLCFWLLNMGF